MSRTLRSVIIDDEPSARRNLANILAKYETSVSVIGEASNANDGMMLIRSERPDLVFLDIKMDGPSGLDLLESFDRKDFQVIFTTAYDHYALPAIKQEAIDYLLKPIDLEELSTAVNRAWKWKNQQTEKGQLLVSTQTGFQVVQLKELLYLQADDNYTRLVFSNGQSLLASKTLGLFEDELPLKTFFRTHRSYIVHLEKITSISKGQSPSILMSNNDSIPLSRTKRDELIEILS